MALASRTTRATGCGRASARPGVSSSFRNAAYPRLIARAAEAEAAPAEEAVVEIELPDDSAVVAIEDFEFNYTEARRNNEWQPSDVESALRFYTDGAGDLPFEADHVTNITGIEDAQVFDEIDNNDAYLNDEYATAGIPEAAPKIKRGKRDEDEEQKGLSEEMQALADQKVITDNLEQSGLLADDELDVKDAPWTWGDDGGIELAGGAVAAGVPASEDAILASLAVLDPTTLEDVDVETRELMSLMMEGVEGRDVDLLDTEADVDDAALPVDAAGELSEVEEAAIESVLAADLGEVLTAGAADALFDAADGTEEEVALSEEEVAAYLAELRGLTAAGAPVEDVTEALGDTTPEPASAAADVPDLPALPELPASLLAADAAFEAALDADQAAASADLLSSVQAQLADLAAIPATEYSDAMFPEGPDLDLYAQFLDSTIEFTQEGGEVMTAPIPESGDGSEGINMYDDLEPELVTASLLETDEDSFDDSGFVERILDLSRVTKVVKGGKLMGFRCVAVVGNGAGMVGVGCQAGREIGTAVKRALVDAKKSLVKVPLVRAGTLPHRVESWSKGAGVVMLPAAAGTGVIAGGAVRSVLELAGVQNVLAKRLGSRSTLNNARVTIKALTELRTLDEVARLRDLPLEYLLS